MLELIQTQYAYNTWATERVLQSLEALTPEEYATVEASGHGSIRDTLAHLISTEWGWFSWFDGSKPMSVAYRLRFGGDEIPTPAAARERWAPVREQVERTIAALTEEVVNESWGFTLPNGFAASLPLWKMLLHVANHSTHTRAQIVAAIRRAGHAPQGIDLIHYLLFRK